MEMAEKEITMKIDGIEVSTIVGKSILEVSEKMGIR